MSSPTKKIFVGTLFQFTSSAPDELMHKFRQALPDPASAPFISYDNTNNLFACTVSPQNSRLQASTLVSQMYSYVDFHLKRENDLVDSSRLQAIPGTDPRDDLKQDKLLGHESQDLLNYDKESEDSDNDSSQDFMVAFWKPANRDITILTNDAATAIADATNCFLFPEPAEKQVRIVGGDMQAALQKLQAMETLLESAAQHRLQPFVDSAVIILRTGGHDAAIKFVRPMHYHPGLDRIMLEQTQEKLIRSCLVVEARLRPPLETGYQAPPNLDLVDVTLVTERGPSQIFQNQKLPIIGVAAHAQPNVPLLDNSNPPEPIAAQRQPAGSRYMGSIDVNRVTEWSRNVDPQAGPDIAPPVPVPEGQTFVRKRVVAPDSDDSDVDAGIEEIRPQPLPSRRRIMPSDSDDSEAGSEAVQHKGAVPESPRSTIFDPFATSQVSEITGWPKILPFPATPGANVNKGVGTVPLRPSEVGENSSPLPADNRTKGWSAVNESVGDVCTENLSPENTMAREGHFNSPRNDQPRDYSDLRKASDSPSSKQVISVYKHATSHEQPRPGSISQSQATKHGEPAIGSAIKTSQSTLPLHGRRPAPANHDTTRPPLTTEMFLALHAQKAGQNPTGSSSVSPSHAGRPSSRVDYTEHKAPVLVRKRNIDVIRQQTLANVQRQIDQGINNSPIHSGTGGPLGVDKIDTQDETTSRHFHRVMNQKAPNPGKKKSYNKAGATQESKKDREARIAKVKAEAYGTVVSSSPTKPAGLVEPMSARKQELARRNPAMAELHPLLHERKIFDDRTNTMIPSLQRSFEAARSFAGELQFEFQFGQVLAIKHDSSDEPNEQKLYRQSESNRRLSRESSNHIPLVSTSILTSNGVEIDRVLATSGRDGTGRLWSQDGIRAVDTVFEFQCQDKSGFSFIINMDQKGSYKIVKPKSIVGKIALLYPDKIWDVVATLQGHMKWYAIPEEILAGAKELAEQVHVPHSTSRAAIYYRQPANKAFVVQNVAIRRISMHPCLTTGQSHFLLKIVEIKRLARSSHPRDKQLYRSHELDYEDMVATGRIHYEVSILDGMVNEAFDRHNRGLELGETTDESCTGKSLVKHERVRQMVELATHMVDSIDWLGASNISTYRRLNEESFVRREARQLTSRPEVLTQMTAAVARPPFLYENSVTAAPTTIPGLSYTPGQAAASIAPSGFTSTPAHPLLQQNMIPGVRARTTAELYRQNGEYFYLGVNGARVPALIPQSESGNATDMLGPDDSASQFGGATERSAASGAPPGHMVGKGRLHGKSYWEDKPEGFW